MKKLLSLFLLCILLVSGAKGQLLKGSDVMKNQIVIYAGAKEKIFTLQTIPVLIMVNAETDVITNSFIIGEADNKDYYGYMCNVSFNEDSTKIIFLYDLFNGKKRDLSFSYLIFDKTLSKINSGKIEFPNSKVSEGVSPGVFFYKEMAYLWIAENRPGLKKATYFYKFDLSKNALSELSFNLPDEYGLMASVAKGI